MMRPRLWLLTSKYLIVKSLLWTAHMKYVIWNTDYTPNKHTRMDICERTIGGGKINKGLCNSSFIHTKQIGEVMSSLPSLHLPVTAACWGGSPINLVWSKQRDRVWNRGNTVFPPTPLLTDDFIWHHLVSCFSYRAWSCLSITSFLSSLTPRVGGGGVQKDDCKLFLFSHKLYIDIALNLSFIFSFDD